MGNPIRTSKSTARSRSKRKNAIPRAFDSLQPMQPANSTILLINERLGRAVALEVGLRIIGTAGIIGTAKKQGLIQSARPFFRQAAC
jgi:hypothetical protein